MGQTIRILVKKPMLGIEPGTVVEVAAKPDGSPAELFWRRRLRDATRAGGDDCVAVVSEPDPSDTLPDVQAFPASGSE